MIPEPFAGSDKLVDSPPDSSGQFVYPARTSDGGNATFSVWRPSPEEIALLVGGGVVFIAQIHGEARPLPMDVKVIPSKVVNAGMAQA